MFARLVDQVKSYWESAGLALPDQKASVAC